MRTVIEVATQFRGPPKSVNGGYACGLMGRLIAGPSRGVLRAPPPLETPLALVVADGAVRLESLSGDLIGEARAAGAADIPLAPPSPGLAAATAAAKAFPGLERPFHPVCFSCGDKLDEGFGLRVFTGQVAGAAEGAVAGPWTPHAAFADEMGLVPAEVVWAALDCPGSVAWVVSGAGGGMLGTMTCEIARRPAIGEACVVAAWPIERSGRKLVSGTALYSGEGELLARSHQIWIGRAPAAQAA